MTAIRVTRGTYSRSPASPGSCKCAALLPAPRLRDRRQRRLTRRGDRPPPAGFVVSTACSLDVRHVVVGPIGERDQQLGRGPAQRGEGILDPNRDLCVDVSVYETVALEASERVREHLLGGAAKVVVEAAVAANAAGKQVKQIDLPFRREKVARSSRAVDHLEVLPCGPTSRAGPDAGVGSRQIVGSGHGSPCGLLGSELLRAPLPPKPKLNPAALTKRAAKP